MNTEQDSSPGKIKLCRTTLKHFRKSMGYSQEAMADQCQRKCIQVSISSIKRAESGRLVNYRIARELARFFNVKIAELSAGSETNSFENSRSKPEPHRDKELLPPVSLPDNCTLSLLYLSLNFSSFRGDSKLPLHQCAQIAGKHGGKIYQQLANSLLILFNNSNIYGLSPIQSVSAALAIERNLKRYTTQQLHFRCRLHLVRQPKYSTHIKNSSSSPQQLQLGISDWDTIFDSTDPGGECRVVVSNEFKEATEILFNYQRLENITYAEQSIWQAVGRKNTDDCSHLPLVGRATQLQQFSTLLDCCVSEKRAHLITLRGEAGVGKSRLIREFHQIARTRGFAGYRYEVDRVSRASNADLCSEIARQFVYANRSPIESTEFDDYAETSPLSSMLAAIRSYHKGFGDIHLIDALRQLLRWQDRLTLITLDDLHWNSMDACTGLLKFVEQLYDLPVLIVLSSRKEEGPLRDLSMLANTQLPQSVLELSSLSEHDAWELAQSYNNITESHRQKCIKLAAGVPLFLVQLLSNSNGNQLLPSSLEMLIQEKLNSLSDYDRYAVKVASVIGQRFQLKVLQAVTDDESYYPQDLATLQLIKMNGNELSFCHELVRKGIYNQLDEKTLKELHLRIGNVMESILTGDHDRTLLQVSYHFDRGDHPRKSSRYHYLAGRIFTAASDYQNALYHLRRAMVQLTSLDQCSEYDLLKMDIQLALAAVYKIKYGWVSHPVQEAYRQAEQICRQQDNHARLAPILFGHWVVKLMNLELDDALAIAKECHLLGEKLANQDIIVQAQVALSNTYFWLGKQSKAVAAGELALQNYQLNHSEFYIQEYGQDPQPLALAFTSLALSLLGKTDQAEQLRYQMLNCEVVSQHAFSRAIALQASAWLDFHLGNSQRVAEQSQELLVLAQELGFPFYIGIALMLRGWARTVSERTAEGIQQIDEGFNRWIAQSGGRIAHSLYCVLMAEALLSIESWEEAKEVVCRGVDCAEQHNERCYLPELLRLRCQLAELQQEEKPFGQRYRSQLITDTKDQKTALFLNRHQIIPGDDAGISSDTEMILTSY